MRFTYNWLKDFVDIKVSAQELSSKLTMAGLEVVSLDKVAGDFVFEVEITSNRPDCLSVAGIAREAAAILGTRLKAIGEMSNKKYPIPDTQRPASFSIEIESKKDCPLYTAKIIRDVKISSSPDWLKKRLELIGCRSINNVVDITNYVMFTWGQPLHAFDLDKLNSDTIAVRRGKPGEKLLMLDGEMKILDSDILVIATNEKSVAIAGVMGGKDTEVTGVTKNVLLEGAVFNPALVRCGRRKLGIDSESSYRFERGLDLGRLEYASSESARLMAELAKGSCVLSKSSPVPQAKVKSINLDVMRVQRVLGTDKIPAGRIKKILDNLGFNVKGRGKNNLKVNVPSHRPDANLAEDLIEEIARIFGYENIPTTLPATIPQLDLDKTRDLVSQTKEMLVGLGLNEVITHSLISRDLLNAQLDQPARPIEIANPLSKEQEILRPGLYLSLLKCLSLNLNQKQSYIAIFEIAKGFSESAGSEFQEELRLGLGLCGTKPHFLPQGLVKDELGFLHLKGILEVLFQRLGIKDYNFNPQNSHQIEVLVKEEKIGIMFYPPAGILEKLDIKNKNVVVAELSLERIFTYADLTKKFTRLPVYPGISRDISFILKGEISAASVLKYIQDKTATLLRQVSITDYYKGKQIPPGFKGLTVSCFYRSDERTLTEAEINPLHAQVEQLLQEKFSAQIR